MQTPIFDKNDGIDEEMCLGIYDNSYDFYVSVLKAFYKETLVSLESMKTALEKCDFENYRILVHGLKGSGGAIGDNKLLELATKANEYLKAGDIQKGTSYHDEITEELLRVQELIRNKVLTD